MLKADLIRYCNMQDDLLAAYEKREMRLCEEIESLACGLDYTEHSEIATDLRRILESVCGEG